MLPRTSKQTLENSLEIHQPEPAGDGNQPKKKKRPRLVVEFFRRRPGFVLLLLPAALLVSLYMVSSEEDYNFAPRYVPFYKTFNIAEEPVDSYLVWNPKCQILSMEPLDPSIRAFVKKEKFENCSSEPRFTSLSQDENGSVVLSIDPAATMRHPGLECCWSAVFRAEKQPKKPTKSNNIDLSIVVKQCKSFSGEATLPSNAQAVMISCNVKPEAGKRRGKPIYENVHAPLDVNKVRDRLRRNVTQATETATLPRKLSVLLLGIDSVSRLNFMRSVPNTERYLTETGWVQLNGYNKMGDNTFPNLMAILTGQNQAQAYSVCKPTVNDKLDQCPFLWHNFRNAGYVTAYGEDETALNTFNYLKMGFTEQPTDYYLRPYMLACEKLLKVKNRFGLKYCTGPETNFDRVFDYAIEFARTFIGLPYFGLFWTNSVSHNNANGLSSMDGRLLDKLKQLEREGVLNDTMIVLLSDHGMRWGSIRNTFVGWYEERLPFIYLWLPEWFKAERPEAYASLLANQHRLTSPFDLYETLRDVLTWSGGQANRSVGCSSCHSLLAGPMPQERGCSDAGISSHWCTCSNFVSVDSEDKSVQKGAQFFLEHMDKLLDGYRNKKGKRLCAKLRLKKVHQVERMINIDNSGSIVYFYIIEVTPGDGKFEVTMRYHTNGTYTLTDNEVSRLNTYASAAECLESGMKQYCYCLK
ncbi:unnamed protein product [Xylocopa violacea]|uniref:Uncharacterized protein n=2 Tax=Xylocopa violacea TaxID=135666 RepID=A0ABP1NPD5_XYLVO